MVCRNALKDIIINETWYASCIYNRLSDKWAVGIMGCRTNVPSDYQENPSHLRDLVSCG